MHSINNLEKFKARIASGGICVGMALTISDPTVSELVGDAGYDFTWIDMEHGPFNLQTTLHHIMAVRGTNAAPFVRVPSNDPVTIKPIIDLVPAAIIVPMIRTVEDAKLAVAACRYPPTGCRGYSPRRGHKFGGISQSSYLEYADEQTLVLIQIEQIEAVRNIDAILDVSGLDGICLGPNDLSGSMGKLGRTTDPEVVEAIEYVLAKAKRRQNLYVGVATGYDENSIPTWMGRGIQWICLNTDYGNLYQRSVAVLDGVRRAENLRKATKAETASLANIK